MHPEQVLFQGERTLPELPAVDHYAGSEKLIRKALGLQQQLGPVFDITCDCEDGAPAGQETAHAHMAAAMVMSADNRFGRVGARVHDVTHPHWQRDVDILVDEAASRLAFITLPKPRSVEDVRVQIDYLKTRLSAAGIDRPLPVHVLIETHGALRDAWQIAAIDAVESLDFGLMDFVSAHHGAIPGDAMRSPGQFEHPLIARAKCDIAAAALANGVIPSHNVTTELTDVAYIRNDAHLARTRFGYMRMWSIHPNQIQPILAAMRPDFSEVEHAIAILSAAQDAQWGPIQHAGKLHDRASYRYYWTLLKRAHTTGADLPAAVSTRFFSA
ncbi:MAG: CoA ester lyase [Rhodocyclaceae bacterium]|nr:CoA ester lyase [Rhodocyclaceae bacterium]